MNGSLFYFLGNNKLLFNNFYKNDTVKLGFNMQNPAKKVEFFV